MANDALGIYQSVVYNNHQLILQKEGLFQIISECKDDNKTFCEYGVFGFIRCEQIFVPVDIKNLIIKYHYPDFVMDLLTCTTFTYDIEIGMIERLKLCCCQFDFTVENVQSYCNARERKKDLLMEILQSMSGNKWNNLQLLEECISTISINLFRSLPSPDMIKTDANDDEMDFRDPSWEHLQLIYELTYEIVLHTHIDKKTIIKHLQGAFLENLIHLFSSADDREPQYVKIIVHAIYGRFMALRKSIRKHLSDYCYKYIYESTLRDSTSWQGLPEILEIFCSIFQGLNIPVKPEYNTVLRNVIIPLHKSFHLDEFHEQLLQCCTQFVTKDPNSINVILGGILKFWPKMSPLKEQLFIDEIVHLLNASSDYIEQMAINNSNGFLGSNGNKQNEQFDGIIIAVIHKLCKCMFSDHHQVAERSLLIWKEESLKLCLEVYSDKCWPVLYQTLNKMTQKYWLIEIRNIAKSVINDLQITNPQFFHQKQLQIYKLDRQRKYDEKSKRKEREGRWKKVRQLAIHQINNINNINK
eukprot:155605_1